MAQRDWDEMSDIGDALTGDGADGRPYSLSALLAPTPALTLGASSNGLGDDLRLELKLSAGGASFRCAQYVDEMTPTKPKGLTLPRDFVRPASSGAESSGAGLAGSTSAAAGLADSSGAASSWNPRLSKVLLLCVPL